MKRKNLVKFLPPVILFAIFAVFTVLLLFVDVAKIGPAGVQVGLSTINLEIFLAIGKNPTFYTLSEVTIYLAILVAMIFAAIGLVQFIKRKKLLEVDREILWLGVIYALAIAAYVFFEIFVVNYRPVLVDGELEAAFPSSHTMLVSTIFMTAAIAVDRLAKSRALKITVTVLASLITAVTIVFRMLSGVHWFTDIVGGVLLAGALITLYFSLTSSDDQTFGQN